MATKPTRPPLGRGLASLLGDIVVEPRGATAGAPQSGLRQIPLDLLDPNPFQPRADFAQESLDELAASIRMRGILQPILARSHPTKPERFFIVAGERRWRAAGIAGLHEVPAIVRDMSDAESATAALIENLQREDLNPMEEAEGYSRLLDELGLTQDKLAEALGKSRSHLTNALRLLNLPPAVQAEVRKGTISFGHARALLAHPDPEAMAGVVRSRGLTVRQTEALASRGAAGKAGSGKRRPNLVGQGAADVTALERRLVERLGFQARVTTDRQGRVSVVLDFADVHQLEAWVEGLA